MDFLMSHAYVLLIVPTTQQKKLNIIYLRYYKIKTNIMYINYKKMLGYVKNNSNNVIIALKLIIIKLNNI